MHELSRMVLGAAVESKPNFIKQAFLAKKKEIIAARVRQNKEIQEGARECRPFVENEINQDHVEKWAALFGQLKETMDKQEGKIATIKENLFGLIEEKKQEKTGGGSR